MGILFFTPTLSGTHLGSKKTLMYNVKAGGLCSRSVGGTTAFSIEVQFTADLFLSKSFVPF
jgi:hypothetical protein